MPSVQCNLNSAIIIYSHWLYWEGFVYTIHISLRYYIHYHAGIPQIESVQSNATNTSVTLQWELPDNIQLSDTYFNVRSTLWYTHHH